MRERAYRLDPAAIAEALSALLSAAKLEIESAGGIGVALPRYRDEGFGFADLVIAAAARRAGATRLVTFDRKVARLPCVELLVD